MKSEKLVNLGIPILCEVLLVLMVSFTFMQIVFREFFSLSLFWTDQVAQFCMTWLVLIGSIWCTKNDRHLNTGFKLHQKINKKLIGLIDGFLALVIAVIAAVVAYQTAILSFTAMGTESLALPWLKMGYAYIALPISMLATCYYYLKNFFKNLVFIFKRD
jgi:TRAP-type C4-dicarboxylate transport system permease small subunit